MINERAGHGDGPRHVLTCHMSYLEETVEALAAADVIGLGYVLRNEYRHSRTDGAVEVQELAWVLELFDDAPTRAEHGEAEAPD